MCSSSFTTAAAGGRYGQTEDRYTKLTVFGLGRQRPSEFVDELRVEHVERRRGRQLGRRRGRRRRLGGTLQAGLRVPGRVSGRHAVQMVRLAAVVFGHGAQRSVCRGADHEVATGRRGQRRAVRRPGAAVHPSGAGCRRGRLVVGTLGHASVPVRFVNVVIVLHDGHHESHCNNVERGLLIGGRTICKSEKEKNRRFGRENFFQNFIPREHPDTTGVVLFVYIFQIFLLSAIVSRTFYYYYYYIPYAYLFLFHTFRTII